MLIVNGGLGNLIDERVTAALVALIVVVGAFSVSQAFLAGRVVEPFSELGVLGPNQKIGDYPNSMLVGENFTLYLYVGNHEGRSMYYRVYVKLSDRSSLVNENTSLDAPHIAYHDVILQNNQTWLKPVTLHIDKPGTNLRLVFELWTYTPDQEAFTYHNRWLQLWVNVTRPV